MAFTLRPYQREAVDAVIAHITKRLSPCLLELATGCHASGHPILMADGSIMAVDDISAGDSVMGPDGLPRIVVDLHRGNDDMYRITPVKGEPFVVNGGHILSLYVTPRRHGDDPSYREISVSDYIAQNKHFKHLHKLQRVDVDMPHQDVAIDPWSLGALIGDGCITNVGTLSFCNPDHEILTALEVGLSVHGCKMSIAVTDMDRGCATLRINKSTKLKDELSALGLLGTGSGDKFIPDVYKQNSKRVRLEILAGLIDTDGHLSRSGFDWISKSKRLADDVIYLCRSVGLAAYQTECIKSCQGGFSGTYFRVSISGDCSMIPVKCERRVAPKRQQIKRPDVTGFTVEHVGNGQYFGFELDGDHLYLDGHFVRHHNSGKSIIVAELAAYMAKAAPHKRVLCIAPSRELVEQNAAKYKAYGFPASIFCASAGFKCLRHQVIFASPQTALKQIEKIAHMGVSAIIIDEAHGITPTMTKLVEAVQAYEINGKAINDKVRIIGMTATPYRMGTGYIYAADHSDPEGGVIHYDEEKAITPYYSRLLYRVTAGELVGQKFLTKPVIGEEGSEHYDTSKLETDRFGNFSAASVTATFEKSNKTQRIIEKVVSMAVGRMGVMIFASTISHAEEIAGYLPAGQVEVVTGKTKKADRANIIELFKARKLRYLVNVDVLCVGFDAPHVDVIAILRATESAGLLQQIIGRGLRLHPDKADCLVLDYAENIARHGLESDIFTPQIRTRKTGQESVEIEVQCPACHCISMKKRRNDQAYDGLAHDEFGNYLISGTEQPIAWDDDGLPTKWHGEVLTMQVLDPSTKDDFGECSFKEIPVPAHYSRRCSNPEASLVAGKPVQCEHRYSFKLCPECLAENDIAARHCCECKERLVDPNEKLTEKAGQAGVMADGETKEILCSAIKCEPYLGQTGKHSVKVTYATEIGSISAWHTKAQHWVFNRLATANGWEIETISDDYGECQHWQRAPKSVKVKKSMGLNGYARFEIRGVSYV